MSTSGGSSGGGGGIQRVQLSLGGVDIATLNSAPVQLLAAPPAGQGLAVVQAAATFDPGVLGFANLFQPVVCYLFYSADFATTLIMGNPLQESTVPPFPVATVVPGDAQAATGAIRYNRSTVENNPLVITNQFDVNRAGPIVTASLAAGGAGYAVGDTGTVDIDKYNGGAAYVVDTVTAVTGHVLTFHLTAAGDGYSLVDNPLTTTPGGAQPGIGAGFTVNVDTIPPPDGNLSVTVLYHKLVFF